MDFTTMPDEEVLQLRNDVNAEADRRIAAMQLRDKTRDLAIQAKDLGRTEQQVNDIVASVVAEVFASEQPVEPEPDLA